MKIMKKKICMSIAASGILFLMGGNLSAEESSAKISQEKKTVQTECPVMGGKINKALFVDYQGKRIYVCCQGCIGKVKENPEKYIKEIEAKGIVLEETPKNESSNEGKKGTSKTENKEGEHAGHH
jgi:YHS domain-containing protein